MNIKKLYQKYSLNTYTRIGPVFVKGRGSFLWDDKGKKYLDLFPGWGVSILGHSHPKITDAISKQAKQLIHLPNNLYFKEQALLAKEIVKKSFPSKVFFANSGAESIEGAIKISRLFGASTPSFDKLRMNPEQSRMGPLSTSKRYEIITMKNSFHGRTFGALSATGQKKHKDLFKPLLPGFKEAEFNNFAGFQRRVNSKTVAVILELIQGEGGVNVANKEYIKKLRNYCREREILFIVDEVQTGMGRTGKLFCYQNYSITPDIMVLSKGLGAGVPISAIVVAEKIADIIKPGMHASTFGGSPLVSRVSFETFKIVGRKNFLKGVKAKGEYLHRRLCKLKNKFAFINKVKGAGLMVGLELAIESGPVFMKCLEKRLIVNATQKNILRVMPALNVTKQELDKGINILEQVFSEITKSMDYGPSTID